MKEFTKMLSLGLARHANAVQVKMAWRCLAELLLRASGLHTLVARMQRLNYGVRA